MQELDLDTITALLKPREIDVNRQKGPLRFYDVVMRCASRGCGSSTYCKVDNIPYCMMHALKDLNSIVLRLEERLRGSYATSSTASTNAE